MLITIEENSWILMLPQCHCDTHKHIEHIGQNSWNHTELRTQMWFGLRLFQAHSNSYALAWKYVCVCESVLFEWLGRPPMTLKMHEIALQIVQAHIWLQIGFLIFWHSQLIQLKRHVSIGYIVFTPNIPSDSHSMMTTGEKTTCTNINLWHVYTMFIL